MEPIHWYGWLILGNITGFIFCMFVSLTYMYYTTIQERKKVANELINRGSKKDSQSI